MAGETRKKIVDLGHCGRAKTGAGLSLRVGRQNAALHHHIFPRGETNALLLPQSAVAQSQGSYQVAVVDSDHKVNMRSVKPGETVGTMWVIDEGLKPGEQVVVEGLAKLKEGTLVTPKPAQLSGEGN